MKKIVAVEYLSLDGYFARTNDETDWFVWDKQMEAYYKDMFTGFDTILFGGTTYKIMADYWPTPASADEHTDIKDFMNNSRKIVFSKTLQNTEWNNSIIKHDINAAEIKAIKQEAGKDIIIFGSGNVVSQLTQLGLMDEYMFIINPVFIGIGKTIFTTDEVKLKLKLLDTKVFDCGNVVMRYEGL